MPGGQRAEAGWQEEGQGSCRAAAPLTPWPSLDFFPPLSPLDLDVC